MRAWIVIWFFIGVLAMTDLSDIHGGVIVAAVVIIAAVAIEPRA